MPCVAMAPPSLIDFILSRDLADGVVVAGCAERACYNRLGIAWSEQRFARTRDPHLRARVPRQRLATVWASALEATRLERSIAAFRQDIAQLPPMKRSRVSSALSPRRDPHASAVEEVGS
jgi:coenzyme F420-reducing hydrogenase delta subunit